MREHRSPWPGAAQALVVSQRAVGAHRRGVRNWGAAGAGPAARTRLWTLGKCHPAGVPSAATAGKDQGGESWDHTKAESEKETGILSWCSSPRSGLGASWTCCSPSKPTLYTLPCSLLNPFAHLISTAETASHSMVMHGLESASHHSSPVVFLKALL